MLVQKHDCCPRPGCSSSTRVSTLGDTRPFISNARACARLPSDSDLEGFKICSVSEIMTHAHVANTERHPGTVSKDSRST